MLGGDLDIVLNVRMVVFSWVGRGPDFIVNYSGASRNYQFYNVFYTQIYHYINRLAQPDFPDFQISFKPGFILSIKVSSEYAHIAYF